MNCILDKLFLHYEKLSAIYKEDSIVLNDDEKNNEEHVIDTFSILNSLRILLSEKKYNEATLKLNLLTLNNRFLVELNNFIKELEISNAGYNLIVYDAISQPKITIDSFNDDINLNIYPKINLLQQDIAFITESISKFESVDLNYTNLITKVNELNDSISFLLNTDSGEKLPSFSQESLDQINQFVKDLQSENENILNVAKKLSKLDQELQNIHDLVTKNLSEVKDSYFKACKLLSDQTIQQVELIKDTTIKTVELVNRDLPDKISLIVDEILVKVDKSIKGNQRGNFMFFAVILFVITFFACWWFGAVSGEKSSSSVIHYMEKSFVPKIFKVQEK